LTGRTLSIKLLGGGLPVNLTGCEVAFYAKKPDGTILFNACTIIDQTAGEIEYTITGQTVAVPGTLKCWLMVIKTGAVVRSQQFSIVVQEAEDDTGAIESQSEFSDLEAALGTLASYNSRLTTAEGDIDSLEGRMATAEGDIAALETGKAPASQGVTNGNSHDHSGGDGGTIAYASLSGLPTLGTAAAQEITDFLQTANVRKLLWSGSWSSGDITVPGTANYTEFMVEAGSDSAGAVSIPCLKTPTSIKGIGGWMHPSGQLICAFWSTFSGDTWTLAEFAREYHTPSGNHSAKTAMSVTAIYGMF